jgi:hypothetical protein
MQEEFKSLITIPGDYTVDRTEMMDWVYFLDDENNEVLPVEGTEYKINTRVPYAMVRLCSIYVRRDWLDSAWYPNATDLNDAGRMLLCSLIDAFPNGKQRIEYGFLKLDENGNVANVRVLPSVEEQLPWLADATDIVQ